MEVLDGLLENRSGFLSILDYLQHNLISTLPEVLLGYGTLIFFISGWYFLFRNRAYKSTVFRVFLVWGLIIIAYFIVIAAPFICYARMHGRWDEDAPGFNKDLLTYKQELRMAVPKDTLCIVGDDVLPRVILYYIDKKCWVLGWEGYGIDNFNIMNEKGAEYIYSDSKSIHESPHVIPYLDELISEHGSIRIYHLKIPNLPG